MTRIAVTGATGFIGRHLLPELARRGADVVVMLRPGTEQKPWTEGLRAVEVDLHDPGLANPFERLGQPETVIHLAWRGLPNYRSLHHFESELPAQFSFLRRLVEGGLSRLLVAGTCFEYGMLSGELSEELVPQPKNPYGFAKDCLRQQLEYLKAARPFALVWARLFYVYGAGQAPNSLLPQFERALAAGEETFRMSGGEQLRDYLPAEAVANDIMALALAKEDIGVVNICSGKPISVRRLVEDWIEERGARIALSLGHYPYPDYEPLAFWGARHKLDSILNARAVGGQHVPHLARRDLRR